MHIGLAAMMNMIGRNKMVGIDKVSAERIPADLYSRASAVTDLVMIKLQSLSIENHTNADTANIVYAAILYIAVLNGGHQNRGIVGIEKPNMTSGRRGLVKSGSINLREGQSS
jgi:hypothetical protein